MIRNFALTLCRMPINLELHIIEELGCGLNAGNQQMISGTGACYIQKMPLRIVNFLQIGIVTNCLYALLKGNNFIIACHYDNDAEFQTFGKVHGAD